MECQSKHNSVYEVDCVIITHSLRLGLRNVKESASRERKSKIEVYLITGRSLALMSLALTALFAGIFIQPVSTFLYKRYFGQNFADRILFSKIEGRLLTALFGFVCDSRDGHSDVRTVT